ncbi:MAG: cupin domain-containing protein [Dehalococcoidia bacterium]
MQKQDLRARSPGSYEGWMEQEGVPIHQALVGVSDAAELPREPWPRMGGRGTFIQMLSLYQAEKGMYVVEVPPGQTLNPERHLYEEFLFVLQGRGATEVWHEGQAKQTFEWRAGSAFAVPLNSWHRLMNAGSEPALVLGLTTAPRIMNSLHDSSFVLNCDYQFLDEYAGDEDHFSRAKSYTAGRAQSMIWETNFIADAYSFSLAKDAQKASGGEAIRFRMGQHWPNGHISQWPVGGYHKGHRHGPGAVIVGLTGKGYVLAWPLELTSRPYENGFGESVAKIDWGPRSVYTPPDNWYHQHFNTGTEPARHIAVHSGIDRRPLLDFGGFEDFPTLVSEREGGLLIEYEDEDPEVRRRFEAAVAAEGVESTMPRIG